MRVHLAWVAARGRGKAKSSHAAALTDDYIARCRPYAEVATMEATDEEQLLAVVAKMSGRTKPQVILLDSRGKQASSEEIAAMLREARDSGTQHVVFAIGGADGWSDAVRKQYPLLSLGRITLPHELARAIVAEQIYRAFTIIAGHPYHQGH